MSQHINWNWHRPGSGLQKHFYFLLHALDFHLLSGIIWSWMLFSSFNNAKDCVLCVRENDDLPGSASTEVNLTSVRQLFLFNTGLIVSCWFTVDPRLKQGCSFGTKGNTEYSSFCVFLLFAIKGKRCWAR